MGLRWEITSEVEEKADAEDRYDRMERAAREAIAGAPRIYISYARA